MTRNPWMTSEDAARRLGVKPETLYAYVSRGTVRSERIPGSRRSRFLRADVERLAARQRRGGRAGLELIVETDLTLLDPAGHLAYRGWDVADAVRTAAPFEEVATWLWSGARQSVTFDAPATTTEAAERVCGALADQPIMDRIRAAVAAIRHTDPFRDDRRPHAVASAGRALVSTMVDALPPLQPSAPAPGASIADRLWPRLSPRPAEPHLVRLLDATLVLLADHELAASTLAARVAASTWADPYLVVLAGLAALGGPLHGGASRAARQLIREVETGTAGAAEAIGNRLRDNLLIPGFGHRIYRERDPRADLVLERLTELGSVPSEQALVATMRERGLPFPNIDFAIAALAERHDMIEDAGEVVFTVSRTAGWLAHAIEEYQHRLRFRPRAVYTGPAPSEFVAW